MCGSLYFVQPWVGLWRRGIQGSWGKFVTYIFFGMESADGIHDSLNISISKPERFVTIVIMTIYVTKEDRKL